MALWPVVLKLCGEHLCVLTFARAGDAVEAGVWCRRVLEWVQGQLTRSCSFRLCQDSLKQVVGRMPECGEERLWGLNPRAKHPAGVHQYQQS